MKLKRMKKYLSILLILTILFGICPLDWSGNTTYETVFAGDTIASGTCGDNITWTITEDTGTGWDLTNATPYQLTLTGSGEMTSYSTALPPWNSYQDTITSISVGKGITTIGKFAFDECVSLKSVSLPDSLIEIGDNAFSNCTTLQVITIPDNVIDIGGSAFSDDISLSEVYLGNNTETIGSYAFMDCPSLTGIMVNSNLKEIYNGAFMRSSLSRIYLPDSLTYIGAHAFRNTKLTSVTIPKNVTEIGADAFYSTSYLSSITVASENTSYMAQDSVLYELQNGKPYSAMAYASASETTAITILDGTEIIASNAFYNANNITDITFPESLTSISSEAFYFCHKLTSVFLPDGLETLSSSCFRECTGLKNVSLGKGLTSCHNSAFFGCTALETISCSEENTVFHVTDNALYNDTTLYLYPSGRQDSVFYLPDTTTSIGVNSIAYAHHLKELYIPASVSGIADYAIRTNNNLHSIYFYGNAPATPGYAITKASTTASQSMILYKTADATGFNTSRWSGFTIADWNPYDSLIDEGTFDSVTWKYEGSIGRMTFSGSGSLPDFTLESPAPWNKYITYIQTIEAEGLTGIGNYAFYQAENLLRMEADAQLAVIGNYAFTDCGKLKYIEISSVDSIGISAFENNSALEGALILEKTGSIGTAAFKNCASLTNITLGAHLQTMEDEVFSGCTNLGYMMLPESVTSIGSSALKDCIALKTINIPAAVTTIDAESFYGNSSLEKVYFYGSMPETWAADSFANGSENLILYYRTSQPDWTTLNGVWNSIPLHGLDKFYTEKEDHYAFANNTSSFGYKDDYRIPRQRYVDVLNNMITGTYYYATNKEWLGSCYGMASTTLEFYENPEFKLTDYDTNAQNLYSIPAPQNKNSALTRLIEGYQISQYKSAISGYGGEISHNWGKYREMIQRIEEFERSGGLSTDTQASPIVMAIYSIAGGHAVIPTSVVQNDTGDFEVSVYDSNFPEKLQTLIIHKDFSGISYGLYKYASFIDYTAVADSMSDVTLHADAKDPSLYLSIDKETGNIVNSEGNGIDEIDGAYEQKPFTDTTEDTFSGIRSFVLPEGNYTLSSTDADNDESVTFYIASQNTYAEITSTDEAASLNIQQTDTANGELVLSLVPGTKDPEDDASTEASSSITLINPQGMERVIEVNSNTATVSITEDDNITIETPSDTTVTLDGNTLTADDGKAEVAFMASAKENPLKLTDLITEISCNETNKLSGNADFSLISNSSAAKDASVTVTYQDEKGNTVAAYTENITVNPGFQTISLDFENLETTFVSDTLEETLTCQVTVSLTNSSAETGTEISATQKTNCTVSRNALVTFDTDGGTGIYPAQSVAAGETVTEPENQPEKEGYTFLGWFEDDSNTAFDFATAITKDITLTARWEKNGTGDTPTDPPQTGDNTDDDKDEPQNPPQTGDNTDDGKDEPQNPPADNTSAADSPSGDTPAVTDVKVSSIRITNKNLKIAAGKKVALTATVLPANAANSKLIWESSNSKWAVVNKYNGMVTTQKAGKGKTVTITASAADGSGIKASVKIKIMNNAVSKITLKAASKTVKAGGKIKIKASLKTTGKKNVNKTLTWTTSNSEWATVKNGIVTTKKAGKGHKVKITAASTDGTNKKATVQIKIR